MSKPMRKMLTIVSIVFLIVFGWYGIKKGLMSYMMAHYVPPPVTVSSSTATAKVWQPTLTSVGTITAVNGVEISAETAGIVKAIYFSSGQFVKQGDLLILLDAAIEQAQLKDNEANLKLSQINYDRDKVLSQKNVVSQSKIDTDVAQLIQAQSAREGTLARIKQKTIISPFTGKLGITDINIGQFVSPGTELVTLQSLDPLLVRFNLPEQYFPELAINQSIEISVNLSKETVIKGTITAINSKVDQTTRNILVEATIPNKNLTLLPGMFALVRISLPHPHNIIALPETAISYSLHGDSVFIIKKDPQNKEVLKAFRQYVTVGERRGDEIAISKGLKPGDLVVTAGQLKLQNGTPVVIDNSIPL